MSTLLFDLRYSLRLLARSPGFAALCILVIAMALGVALTIYVLVRNQGLAPPPLPDGERYVAIKLVEKKTDRLLRRDGIWAYTYQTIRKHSQSYEFLGAVSLHGSVTISDGELAETPWGAAIESPLMARTGVAALKGRVLQPADDAPGAPRVAVIGLQLWQNYYGGREDIIGHHSKIDGELHTIVGVMPDHFRFPTDHHVWIPLQLPAVNPPDEDKFHITPVGILKTGVSIDQADAEVKEILANMARENPDLFAQYTATVIPYIQAAAAQDFTLMNSVMLAAAISILLLACLNVGNLLLVRANERQQELAIRSALGGTRGRIVQQVLLESLLICAAGGVLGLWLGSFGAEFIRYQIEVVIGSSYLPFWMNFELGRDVIALVLLVTLLIWLLAGGIPAWRSAGVAINSLSSGSKGVAAKGSSKFAKSLVASEVVFSFFLLILSGSFVSAVQLAQKMDYGIPTENIITGAVQPNSGPYEDLQRRYDFYEQLRRDLLQEPDVLAVSYSTALPGDGNPLAGFQLEDRDLREGQDYPKLLPIPVDYDYLDFINVKLLEGRGFEPSDSRDSLPVAIVEQDFAESLWPGQSPLGKRVQLDPTDNDEFTATEWVTIVGVAPHIDQGQSFKRYKGLHAMYRPLAQHTPWWAHILVKYREVPQRYEGRIKGLVSQIDREVPIHMVRPLSVSMFNSTRIMESLSELFVVVALVALLLAGTGIYGVVSRTVLLRSHEMAIRRALGQPDIEVVKLFLKQGALYLLVGGLVGGGAGIVTCELLAEEFPKLLDSIVWVVIIISLLMAALVLTACYLPARRMVSLEPAVALHDE